MGRAARARRIASAAAFGGGGVGALGLAAYGVLAAEARVARKVVGQPFEGAPDDNGVYGHGLGEPVQVLVVGDSTAAGMGADHRYQTVGAIIATAAAALSGRPVELHNAAVIGAESKDLAEQLDGALETMPQPDVALVMVGANDVTHRIDRSVSVRHLAMTVRRLRDVGTEVVVGTCPDLGVVRPVPQPLRLIAQRWSRDLAAAQTVAVVEQGGRTVSLGDLLEPDFAEHSSLMFSKDQFHPSPAGYARAASAILPSVLDALGLTTVDKDRGPDHRRGERIGPVAEAAVDAVADPGTEVSGTGQVGTRGRRAVLRRRRRSPIPADAGSAPEREVETDALDTDPSPGDAPSDAATPATDDATSARRGSTAAESADPS